MAFQHNAFQHDAFQIGEPGSNNPFRSDDTYTSRPESLRKRLMETTSGLALLDPFRSDDTYTTRPESLRKRLPETETTSGANLLLGIPTAVLRTPTIQKRQTISLKRPPTDVTENIAATATPAQDPFISGETPRPFKPPKAHGEDGPPNLLLDPSWAAPYTAAETSRIARPPKVKGQDATPSLALDSTLGIPFTATETPRPVKTRNPPRQEVTPNLAADPALGQPFVASEDYRHSKPAIKPQAETVRGLAIDVVTDTPFIVSEDYRRRNPTAKPQAEIVRGLAIDTVTETPFAAQDYNQRRPVPIRPTSEIVVNLALLTAPVPDPFRSDDSSYARIQTIARIGKSEILFNALLFEPIIPPVVEIEPIPSGGHKPKRIPGIKQRDGKIIYPETWEEFRRRIAEIEYRTGERPKMALPSKEVEQAVIAKMPSLDRRIIEDRLAEQRKTLDELASREVNVRELLLKREQQFREDEEEALMMLLLSME